ncbi:MAG: rod shape-determining protein MreC [Candidatus Eremiobacteraeota bacterium]|nr:rod shape-determining protein MreC [Candidatus Eremiobacteraeota bacterium]
MIVAALIALLQLDFARAGRTSPLTLTLTAITAYAQLAVATVVNGARSGYASAVALPGLTRTNARLRAQNDALRRENDELHEEVAAVPAARDLLAARLAHPDGLAATVIGYDPEAVMRVITIDRGLKDGVARDAGVVSGEGVVGRVIEVDPLSAKVLLVNDPTSNLPAVVQHGRWWAIAVGTSTRIKLQYISQDAKLKVGDRVVTGEGRSFHAGVLIGRIARIQPTAAGALDQSAIVEPATNLSALSHVVVLPQILPQR